MDTKRLEASIVFGVVSIPVGVVPVVKSTANGVRFTNLHATTKKGKPCLTPLKQPKTCPVCEVEVEADQIVSGYKHGDGYVVVTDAEKESVSAGRSPLISISKFVSNDVTLEETIRLSAQSSYWLVPEVGVATEHYAVLMRQMDDSNVVGMAHASLWGKQWPVVLAPSLDHEVGIGLLLTKLTPAKAVRRFDVELPRPGVKMLSTMKMLIEEYQGGLDASDLSAPEQDDLRDLVDAKVAGREFVPGEVVEPKPMPDLMAAMKESIALAKASKKQRAKAAA